MAHANSPAISIVLPVHNGEKYLEQAIESCLLQTFDDFELLLVNDSSTDRSLQIMEKWSVRDRRIRIIHNEKNLKLPGSLNRGFEHALGRFYTWTSDDNIPNSNWLSRLLEESNRTQADIVYSDYTVVNEDENIIQERKTGPESHLVFSSCIGASFLYRREVFDTLEGFRTDLVLIEDYDFWARALKYGFRWSHIPESLYKYRAHGQSLSAQHSSKIDRMVLKYKIDHFDEYRLDSKASFMASIELLVMHSAGMPPVHTLTLLNKAFRSSRLRFTLTSPYILARFFLQKTPRIKSFIKMFVPKSKLRSIL